MTTHELNADLGRILALEEAEQTDWTEVQQLCQRLSEQLQEAHAISDSDLPHGIWHFLADADIRERDAEYAGEQRRELRSWLASAE